jgi:ABC-type antimicrobial peptide transport system permease subunit
MYWTYLRRELSGRKKQTAIVAAGLAVAIALVIVVTALSAGVRDAQSSALASVYGVGTDLTVTGAAQEPGQGGGSSFQFQKGAGQTSGGTTTVSQSRLMTDFRRGTLAASTLSTVTKTGGVQAASAALALTDTTFSGQMPDAQSGPPSGQSGTSQGSAGQGTTSQGGSDGAGGSQFDVASFSVLGVDANASKVGPLSSISLTSGRALTSSDAGKDVAVVDASYAKTKSLKVGGTVSVAGTDMAIVGVVASASDSADTAADVFIPLDVAQKLSGSGDVVSTVYVQSSSSSDASTVQAALEKALPKATVSSQADLASTVSSSLASASSLISSLGLWLSVTVLAVALVLAVLFTISGVSRRTREFGTLKAIGWSNGRVVGQVAGESGVQGLIGGVVGLVVGLAVVLAIDVISPTISTAPTFGGGGPGGGSGGGFAAFGAQASAAITLHAPVTVWVVVAAVGLAILGGLVAGAFGGWRAARLSPAEALRSVG